MLSNFFANAPVGKTLSVPVWSWFGAVREMFFSFSQRKKVPFVPCTPAATLEFRPAAVATTHGQQGMALHWPEDFLLGTHSVDLWTRVSMWAFTRVQVELSWPASTESLEQSGQHETHFRPPQKKNISGTDCVYLYLVRSIQWYWRLGYQKAPDG